MLKTCASIQSFCCYTKVGLALAFPTLEAMGVECAPVPSCLLSTEVHGYGDFYIRSCTDDMKATFTHWNRENLKWDSIYTGFLSDPNQVDVIIDFVKTHPEALIMIDPAFADDGHIYTGLSMDLVEKMKKLLSVADITVPNPTEACFLLNKPQKESMTTDELDKFTHRQSGYIYEVIKRSKQGKRRRKYIISSPAFEHGRRAHGTYYIAYP